MKATKPLFISAVIAIVAFSIGASAPGDSRPSGVSAERWITLSDKAGLVVGTESAGTPILVELHVMTSTGWRRARVDNPAALVPLGSR